MKILCRSVLLLCAFTWGPSVQAQQSSGLEYLESSSPMADGGRVTTRVTPGSGTRTVTTSPTLNLPGRDQRGISSVPSREPRSIVARRPQVPRNALQSVDSSQNYVYPTQNAQSAGRYSYPLAAYPSFRARAVGSAVGSPNRNVNYQVPTLGITTDRPVNQNLQRTSVARVAQNCQCPAPVTNLNVAGFALPANQNVASQAPSLTIEDPENAQAGSFGSRADAFQLQTPGIGITQFDNPNRSFGNPTNFGAYQPLLRLVNMKPGTYLGQGIVGQPKAYVDGQPIRNLFRYLLP